MFIATFLLFGVFFPDPAKLVQKVHSAWLELMPPKNPITRQEPEELVANSSDTFAIPYADPSISNGTGATVRVSLPNAELLAWGIPSLDREPGDMVPVDLTLDDNGLPQAVRLLPATLSNPEETYP
jgi:hypothetical protein